MFPTKDDPFDFELCSTFGEFYGNLAYYYQQAVQDEDESLQKRFIPFFMYLYSIKDEQSTPEYIQEFIAAFSDKRSFIANDTAMFSSGGLFKVSSFLYNMCHFPELEYTLQIASAERVWKNIISRFNRSWERSYEALFAEYSPIENYKMEEDENVGSKVVIKGGQDVSTFGYNTSSQNGVPTGTASSETTTEGKYDDNKRKLTRHGNIGVTQNVTMIQAELELRRTKFIDIIINDLLSVLTRPEF